MAAQFFKTLLNGIDELVQAITSSSGSEDEGKIPALNTDGKLSETFFPAGIGTALETLVCSEAISSGKYVNIFNDSGTMKCRLADASAGYSKRAMGFVLVGGSMGETLTIYPLDEINSALTGLTLGAEYWLGIAGAVVSTPYTPGTDVGYLSQYIGEARSETTIRGEEREPVVLP